MIRLFQRNFRKPSRYKFSQYDQSPEPELIVHEQWEEMQDSGDQIARSWDRRHPQTQSHHPPQTDGVCVEEAHVSSFLPQLQAPQQPSSARKSPGQPRKKSLFRLKKVMESKKEKEKQNLDENQHDSGFDESASIGASRDGVATDEQPLHLNVKHTPKSEPVQRKTMKVQKSISSRQIQNSGQDSILPLIAEQSSSIVSADTSSRLLRRRYRGKPETSSRNSPLPKIKLGQDSDRSQLLEQEEENQKVFQSPILYHRRSSATGQIEEEIRTVTITDRRRKLSHKSSAASHVSATEPPQPPAKLPTAELIEVPPPEEEDLSSIAAVVPVTVPSPVIVQAQPRIDLESRQEVTVERVTSPVKLPPLIVPATPAPPVPAIPTYKIGNLGKIVSDSSEILEHFELGKLLGDGNFAVVKHAQRKIDGHEFAIKVIDKSKLRGKVWMLESEIRIMKRCNHRNIIRLKDEFETPSEVWLVLDLIKGGDLFDAITKSVRFSEEVASKMVFDMASALYYLHARSIMHRDLKPENFLVLRHRDGRLTLKLADFGLAMEVRKPEYTICGTPTYIAPEILQEIGYGLPVDIWALGVITYILLCGFPPFKGAKKSQTDLFRRIKEGTFDFVRPYWDRVSQPAMNLILRVLVVDQHKRCKAIDVLSDPWVYSNGKPPESTDTQFALFETSRLAYRDELEAFARRAKNFDSPKL